MVGSESYKDPINIYKSNIHHLKICNMEKYPLFAY